MELVKLADAIHDHDQRKGVTLDGEMVTVRGDGWREADGGDSGW